MEPVQLQAYERPTLTEVGTVRDLTLGGWGFGNADSLIFTIWGIDIEITYGVS